MRRGFYASEDVGPLFSVCGGGGGLLTREGKCGAGKPDWEDSAGARADRLTSRQQAARWRLAAQAPSFHPHQLAGQRGVDRSAVLDPGASEARNPAGALPHRAAQLRNVSSLSACGPCGPCGPALLQSRGSGCRATTLQPLRFHAKHSNRRRL